MSGQVTTRIELTEFTFDSKDGLLIEPYSGDGSWLSLQSARELLEFLKQQLEPGHEPRSTLRPFFD